MSDYSKLSDEELQEHIDAYAKLVASNIRKEENENKLVELMLEQQTREGGTTERPPARQARKRLTSSKHKPVARETAVVETVESEEKQIKKYIVYSIIAISIYLLGIVFGGILAQL